MNLRFSFQTCLLFVLMVSFGCKASENLCLSKLYDAFRDSSTNIEFRLRYENLKQQNLKDSNALTLRSMLGFQTASLNNTSLNVELTDVASLFGQNYNPGPGNFFNKSQYSLIPDARGAGLTQGKIIFNGIKSNILTLGRQYIQLDNERFVGKVNWRQYPQSFDAFSWHNKYFIDLDLLYSYIIQVDTTYSNNLNIPNARRSLDTNLIHATYNGNKYANLVGYVYLNKDHNLAINSNSVYGVRVTSKESTDIPVNYTVEYALQYGVLGNPSTYAAHYIHAKVGKSMNGFNGLVALEILSGNATEVNKYFNTPYASKHNFNGYAGVFNRLPNQGLQDYFATLSYAYKICKANATFHYFLLDKSLVSKRAGQELDLTLDLMISKQLAVNIGYANYVRSVYAAPSTKDIWAMLTADLM